MSNRTTDSHRKPSHTMLVVCLPFASICVHSGRLASRTDSRCHIRYLVRCLSALLALGAILCSLFLPLFVVNRGGLVVRLVLGRCRNRCGTVAAVQYPRH